MSYVDHDWHTLTPLRLSALQLAAEGATNVEIAHALGSSKHMAEEHIRICIKLLGAKNRTQAVALAIGASLISAPALSEQAAARGA